MADDDDYLNTAISPHLGTIQLILRHVELEDKEAHGGKTYQSQILHERSKKAMGHSVQLAAPTGVLVLRFVDSVLADLEMNFSPRRTRYATQLFLKNLLPLFSNIVPSVRRSAVAYILLTCIAGLLRAEGIAPPQVRQPRAASPADVLDLTMDVDEEDADDTEINKLEVTPEYLSQFNYSMVPHRPDLVH